MKNVDIQLKPGPVPPDPIPPVPDYIDDFPAFVQRLMDMLQGVVKGKTLEGSQGTTPPSVEAGLYLNGNIWNKFSVLDNRYLPMPIAVGQFSISTPDIHVTRLIGKAQNTDVTLRLPDDDGATLLTLERLNNMTRGLGITRALSGNKFNVFWGQRYMLTPSSAFEVTEGDEGEDGAKIDLWILTPSGTVVAFDNTWPETWLLDGGSLPVIGSSDYIISHVVVENLGGVKLVNFKSDFLFGGSDNDPDIVDPTIINNNVVAGTSELLMYADEALAGVTITPSDFTVTRNGDTNPVIFAEAIGSLIRVMVRDPYMSGNTGDIEYTGTSVKDIAGNVMAGFTLPSVNIVSASAFTVLRGAPNSGTILPHSSAADV